MLDYMGPDERADAMCLAAEAKRRAKLAEADAKIDAEALAKLADDMGLHDHQNRDSGAGLPLVMIGSDATQRLADLTDGRTPSQQNDLASRTDAASFYRNDRVRVTEVALSVCRDAEHSAWQLLVAANLTARQHDLLSAYHVAICNTRAARIEWDGALSDAMFDRLIGGSK